VNVTSANLAGNGGSVANGDGETEGSGDGVAAVAAVSVAAPAFSFEDLFWQADVKKIAEIAISNENRKIIFFNRVITQEILNFSFPILTLHSLAKELRVGNWKCGNVFNSQ
jgi:hypothetical protein